MHLPSKHERRFLETLLEKSHSTPLSSAQQLGHWKLLANSEAFDHWCAKKFPSVKRYGLEGAEGMMVALGVVLDEAKARGMDDVVLCVRFLLLSLGRSSLMIPAKCYASPWSVERSHSASRPRPSYPRSQGTSGHP